MKLKDIANQIDKSEKNKIYFVDIEEICRDFEIEFYDWIEQERLTAYWVGKWCSTDTCVGYKMYFLDDEPVAFSIQNARKSDENFYWFGEDAAIKTKNYILSIIPEKELSVKYVDLEDDIGESYKIEFNGQVIDWSKARYKGEPIEFIERIRKTPDWGIDQESRVRLSSGEEIIVNIEDLDFVFDLDKTKAPSKTLDDKMLDAAEIQNDRAHVKEKLVKDWAADRNKQDRES